MAKNIIKLTEEDLQKIIKESVKGILKEDANKDNAVIDAIGEQIEPMYSTMMKLQLTYGRYLGQYVNNPNQGVVTYNFMGRFAKAFNDVINGLKTMDMIYNH